MQGVTEADNKKTLKAKIFSAQKLKPGKPGFGPFLPIFALFQTGDPFWGTFFGWLEEFKCIHVKGRDF